LRIESHNVYRHIRMGCLLLLAALGVLLAADSLEGLAHVSL
jgi:hypothetical protein